MSDTLSVACGKTPEGVFKEETWRCWNALSAPRNVAVTLLPDGQGKGRSYATVVTWMGDVINATEQVRQWYLSLKGVRIKCYEIHTHFITGPSGTLECNSKGSYNKRSSIKWKRRGLFTFVQNDGGGNSFRSEGGLEEKPQKTLAKENPFVLFGRQFGVSFRVWLVPVHCQV